MIEVLEFIFRDFWTWSGTAVILYLLAWALGTVLKGVRGP